MTAEVWALADGRPGNLSQCLGTVEALGLPFAVKEIAYDRWVRLPNLLRGASLLGVDAAAKGRLTPPWPRIVVAAGRRAGPVARWIKARSGAFLVQIMDPGLPRGDYDLIAVPWHDGTRPARANEMRMVGAPHRVTPERLAAEADAWRPRLAHLPGPYVGVIVGDLKTEQLAAELGRRASAFAQKAGGSLLVTTSRRTDPGHAAALIAALAVPHETFLWRPGADNPYFAFIGLADAVLVTGDSMSMCTESCASGNAVYIFAPPEMALPKYARLHSQLYERGLARPLTDEVEFWTHPPLNPAADIAAEIRRRLKLGQV